MSFQQGLSGLNAASKSLDVIGNNVANAGTVGFKGSQAQFADVFSAALGGGGASQVGIGTKLAAVVQQFTQGNITSTANPLDIAINGDGFFRMSQNGAVTYSRNGQFQLDKDGFIVNNNKLHLTGYDVDATGQIVATTPVELQFTASKQSLPSNPTGDIDVGLNLDSRAAVPSVGVFDPNNPLSYNSSTSTSVYDSLGNSHILALYFVKQAAPVNTWDVEATFDGTVVAPAPGTLTFNGSGALTTAMPLAPPVSIVLANGATTPLVFSLDFTGSTQFGSNFGVNTLSQDGFASGTLSGFNIGADGVIQGRYTNGQSKNLGQVVLTSFANPQGLQPLGNNQWSQTPESGQPLVGAPGTGKLGVMQSAAVEDANVDLTGELVNMITAQRIYQANAQTIKTQDAVLQTLVNLR